MDNKDITLTKYMLKPGFIYVSSRPAIVSTVLGSCVSVCIYDSVRNTGGMNHFQKPKTSTPENSTARFGNISTMALVNIMLKGGSKAENLEAQIIGGSFNPKYSKKDIGKKNIKEAKKALKKKKVKIVSEDVGGAKGRKVVFNTLNNEVAVVKVENLRESDWYPYKNDRLESPN